MKILLCGLGSIGKRHARLMQECFPYHRLVALRTFRGQEANDLGIPELRSWDEVDGQSFDVAFITNPTCLHLQYALECAKRRMHLFIEKPIDCALSGLEDLLGLVQQARLTAYVAYPVRFHPVVRALKPLVQAPILHSRSHCASYLPAWRPGHDHRASYSAHRDQGGGVLLDLSHDIDLIQCLFGDVERITGDLGRRSDVTVDAEDYADLILTHPAGRSTLHLNYFSRTTERWIAIDTPESHIHADLVQSRIHYTSAAETWTREFPFERGDMYRDQLRYFFANLSNPRLENNVADASRLFRQIIACRESA